MPGASSVKARRWSGTAKRHDRVDTLFAEVTMDDVCDCPRHIIEDDGVDSFTDARHARKSYRGRMRKLLWLVMDDLEADLYRHARESKTSAIARASTKRAQAVGDLTGVASPD